MLSLEKMDENAGVKGDQDLVVQQKYDPNVDYVINEYMERLGTRLNILETELKYAWRALDLLSQEYIKMWERLEKLEGLLYEQQSVISQLLDFYTTSGTQAQQATVASLQGKLGELEVIREILGNGAIEDGLEEGLDIITHNRSPDIEEMQMEEAMPDEAFYKSLNQAYREDLVGGEPSYRMSQLGMIWEEREEGSDNAERKPIDTSVRLEASQDIYSALDYKDYRGNTPCIGDDDLAQLTKIDSIDHITIEKLDELDRLSNKLQQDSVNIKHLRRKLLESPVSMNEAEGEHIDVTNVTDLSNIDETLQQIYEDEKWSFASEIKDKNEFLMLAKSDLPNMLSFSSKSGSRFSLTDADKEVAETLAGDSSRSPTSPRRRTSDLSTCNAPFTTVTGRLAYSAAVQHVEQAEAAAAAAAMSVPHSNNPFYCDSPELNSLISASYETQPGIFNMRNGKPSSPTLSICSIRTRQDGYIDPSTSPKISQNHSPPPPAPDRDASFLNKAASSNNVFLDTNVASASTSHNHERLSPKPHSPKSTKSSPRRAKSHSFSMAPAKSDSGLSSMSGWSSLEKSPGSPKNGKIYADGKHSRLVSPVPMNYNATMAGSRPFMESSLDSKLSEAFLPGGHQLSAFTTVKSPCGIDALDGYGNFVPAPAPASDINVSPNRKKKPIEYATTTDDDFSGSSIYQFNQPAIYSVAGSNRDSYTCVYTGSNADYSSQTNYPDLIEPYENNEYFNSQQKNCYHSSPGSETDATQSRYKSSGSRDPEDFTNHEGYKTAMHRTMFPTGNITDALSYYPTSSRNDTSTNQYVDLSPWHRNGSSRAPDRPTRTSESPEACYNTPPQPERSHSHNPQQTFDNSQNGDQHSGQWSQRQEIPYLDLDLRNKNVPEYVVQQQHGQNLYYDPSGVIMTQSGYLTISSSTDHRTQHHSEAPKKMKRANTLKSAMHSVSHWLPTLHLPKRSRSHSLPGVKRENMRGHLSKKKKKNGIVSTVSDIIQKAKRKTSISQHYSSSLSDPEHSENEWSTDRTRYVTSEDDRSEDSSSLFSESMCETDSEFSTIENNSKSKRVSQTEQKTNDKYGLQPVFETDSNLPEETDIVDRSDHNDTTEEMTNSSVPFLSVAIPKKNSLPTEKSPDDLDTDNKMVVLVGGGASMEFAVSRALGRYRQRQTSFSDDPLFNEEDEIILEEITEEREEPTQSAPQMYNKILPEQKSSDSQTSSENNKHNVADEVTVSEDSPSTISIKSHTNRFLPKQQLSLEIPGGRDDDDSRSTHSWRSTSRVSSRRQSTEDSIDSEDEWYCYELRKLEEMERQTHLEQEMGATLLEEPEPLEDEQYEPNEDVRERMSFVLRELRMTAKVTEGVLDEEDNKLLAVQGKRNREKKRPSFHLDNAAALFEKIKHYHHEESQDEVIEKAVTEDRPERLELPSPNEQSSGATSGPDSAHSTDEYDEAEMAVNDEFARCHVSKENEEDENQRAGVVTNGNVVLEIPKIQLESETPAKEEKEDKEGIQGGSRWKLLKTLKERKAEEKSNQGKMPVQPVVEKTNKDSGIAGDQARANGHPGDNPFYSNIDSMPDIRPIRRKSIPLVSDLVSSHFPSS
ncbi:unnamed protein product [Phaedon cochleariae]|uniref:Uncharacterized protein n=1 Tax=Phaedon cochleariae TaxID=80249 RepID=A0A9P0DAR5_PHACE|nr:unnamed protein product [Phaedon cochleariae]